MKKLLIYKNKEYTSVHIINDDEVIQVLMNLLKVDVLTDRSEFSSLDELLHDNDISFEVLPIRFYDYSFVLPEGVTIKSKKTEYYNE